MQPAFLTASPDAFQAASATANRWLTGVSRLAEGSLTECTSQAQVRPEGVPMTESHVR